MKFLNSILKLFYRLPLGVLYWISNLIYLVLFYLVGYRKKVVTTNIQNSYPEKSREEQKAIAKQFYHNFADYLVETAKAMTLSQNELQMRVQHINQDVFRQAKAEKKNVIMLAGHVFNWEWFIGLSSIIPQEHSYPVYRKINNSFWESQIVEMRNRFGNKSLEASEVIRQILKTPNDGNSAYMFVADHSPHISAIDVGTFFLNQITPTFIGYDRLATKLDLAFVYCDMKKVKRGYYQIKYYRIHPENEHFEPLEVVKKFYQLLENSLRKRPDNYLWSHNRWKNASEVKRII